MWWWILTWGLVILAFLGGYITGQGFRGYREQDERVERDSLLFLAGFYRAWNLELNAAPQEPAEGGPRIAV